jgi:hypothetical protein
MPSYIYKQADPVIERSIVPVERQSPPNRRANHIVVADAAHIMEV